MFSLEAITLALRDPRVRYIGGAIVGFIFVAGLVTWGYLAIDGRGYARAERVCEVAEAKDQNLLLHAAIRDAEAAHQFTLAEISKGEALSKQLSITQRKLNETKTEYLAYANAIVGNCPDSLRVLMSAPSHSDREGADQGATASPPADPTATVAAASIGANIAVNRWRCETNYAQCSSLLEWHKEGPVK